MKQYFNLEEPPMKSTLSLTSTVLFFFLAFSMSAAQDAAERLGLEQAERDRPAMKDVTITKKITGRLPNGYKSVVTNTQRDEIYKIQKEYNELIELLKLRIELMEVERDRRVDALLDDEQVQKLRKARGALESEKEKKKPAAKTRKTATTTEE